MERIDLGDRVKDKVSGVVGVIIAITEWLYGCRRVNIQPEKAVSKGIPAESFTVDEPQVILIKKRVLIKVDIGTKEKKKERVHGNRKDVNWKTNFKR